MHGSYSVDALPMRISPLVNFQEDYAKNHHIRQTIPHHRLCGYCTEWWQDFAKQKVQHSSFMTVSRGDILTSLLHESNSLKHRFVPCSVGHYDWQNRGWSGAIVANAVFVCEVDERSVLRPSTGKDRRPAYPSSPAQFTKETIERSSLFLLVGDGFPVPIPAKTRLMPLAENKSSRLGHFCVFTAVLICL